MNTTQPDQPRILVKVSYFKGTFVQRLNPFSVGSTMANGDLALFEGSLVFEPCGRWQFLGQSMMAVLRLRYDEIDNVEVAGPLRNWIKITTVDGQIKSFALPREELQRVYEFIMKKIGRGSRKLVCPKCGNFVESSAKFCGTCGVKLERYSATEDF